jgi:hypothetical protein
MATANLVFFGSQKDSKQGLERSFVLFLVLLALIWVWFGTFIEPTTVFTHLIAAMSLALVLASAIGVYLPNSKTTDFDIVLYSALVGFVVSTAISVALVVWADKSLLYGAVVISVFVILCALLGFLNFKYFKIEL